MPKRAKFIEIKCPICSNDFMGTRKRIVCSKSCASILGARKKVLAKRKDNFYAK
jgi:endogenous inhibitor of DNA gyrase (YacG/DUF329 family)